MRSNDKTWGRGWGKLDEGERKLGGAVINCPPLGYPFPSLSPPKTRYNITTLPFAPYTSTLTHPFPPPPHHNQQYYTPPTHLSTHLFPPHLKLTTPHTSHSFPT
ncbi:hypothetical protein Pcinc_040629 [Petrolisthes cinctipes]|uniref:Uncharacterized protein n=1 Tax=Petrolisthes cinctipes TaxID=88211 RepID=A0AAE1EJB3_PETCI|nr:hypothetical protein Pcinc_040629 [Petrolisthes cinctipes]